MKKKEKLEFCRERCTKALKWSDEKRSYCQRQHACKEFRMFREFGGYGFLEALQLAITQGRLFRPVGWRGMGCAYESRCSLTYLVPSKDGGQLALFPTLVDLQGAWEIVDYATVLKEESEAKG